MKIKMKTKHKTQLEKRHKEFIKDKKLKILILNSTIQDGIKVQVRSEFNSLEEAEHKVRLDIMTNAFYGFEEPIKIFVRVD